jgi:signal peptidase II
MSIFFAYLTVTLLLDLLTKYLTILYIPPFHSIPLLGTFLQFTYVQNHGAAFGILPGKQFFLIAVSLIVASGVAWFLYKERPKDHLSLAALGLLMAGTIGNLYNRMFLGYVVDFIDLNFWPTFNIADMAINVGVALLVWQVFCTEKAMSRPQKKRKVARKGK